jgi:hypothetical protein
MENIGNKEGDGVDAAAIDFASAAAEDIKKLDSDEDDDDDEEGLYDDDGHELEEDDDEDSVDLHDIGDVQSDSGIFV